MPWEKSTGILKDLFNNMTYIICSGHIPKIRILNILFWFFPWKINPHVDLLSKIRIPLISTVSWRFFYLLILQSSKRHNGKEFLPSSFPEHTYKSNSRSHACTILSISFFYGYFKNVDFSLKKFALKINKSNYCYRFSSFELVAF